MFSPKRRWVWVLLFVWVALLLGTLATGWNVVLVHLHYPVSKMVLGTVGFAAALGIAVLFFVRLLQEMHLNQLQSEFVATVSHELKTPIAALELTSTLLRDTPRRDSEADRLWAAHDQELQRLREDVEELLEAARLQTRAVRLNRQRLPLEAWLRESSARWRAILGPGSTLVRGGEPLNADAFVDPRAFSLITDNLIDNARKFSVDRPRVTVETFSTPRHWRIQVRDEGWGFEPRDAKRVFRRFFRAPTPAPHAISGTGLGLYLAASAARRMGLSLKAESAGTGKGAMFTLEGPRAWN